MDQKDGVFTDLMADLLKRGHPVRFQASGQSMHPTIEDGEMVRVEPVTADAVSSWDVILYRSGPRVIAHRVIAIEVEAAHLAPTASASAATRRFRLRGDASSCCDSLVESAHVLGKVVSVERRGRSVPVGGRKEALLARARARAGGLKSWVGSKIRSRESRPATEPGRNDQR